MRSLPRALRIVIVLAMINALLFLYFKTRSTSVSILQDYAIHHRLESVIEFKNAEVRSPAKYHSIDPSEYGDLFQLPLKPFLLPQEIETMDEITCADVFAARYTRYCERTTDLILKKIFIDKLENSTTANVSHHSSELPQSKQDALLEYCSCFPPTMIGRQNISGILPEATSGSNEAIEAKENSDRPSMEPVLPGGRWSPKDCRARQRVAIIIPFRDRQRHLEKLLDHLHPVLQRQQLDYAIFVVEQNEPANIFNKGMLMNSGFLKIHGDFRKTIERNIFSTEFPTPSATNFNSKFTEPLKTLHTSSIGSSNSSSTSNDISNGILGKTLSNKAEIRLENSAGVIGSTLGPELWGTFDCYIFHDVDMLPEDDRNMYTCSKTPRHVGVYISKYNYTRCCGAIFGGATAFTAEHFINVNGYSNEYYGWGGEDDDMWYRLLWRRYQLIRYPRCVSRYTMIQHQRDKRNWENPNRVIAVKSRPEVYKKVGLSSLDTKLVKAELRPRYTWLLFDLPETIQMPDGKIIPQFKRTKDGRTIRIT